MEPPSGYDPESAAYGAAALSICARAAYWQRLRGSHPLVSWLKARPLVSSR